MPSSRDSLRTRLDRLSPRRHSLTRHVPHCGFLLWRFGSASSCFGSTLLQAALVDVCGFHAPIMSGLYKAFKGHGFTKVMSTNEVVDMSGAAVSPRFEVSDVGDVRCNQTPFVVCPNETVCCVCVYSSRR
jgi:hypothetical protein